MDPGREHLLPLSDRGPGRAEDGPEDSDGRPDHHQRVRHRVHRAVLGRRRGVEVVHRQRRGGTGKSKSLMAWFLFLCVFLCF